MSTSLTPASPEVLLPAVEMAQLLIGAVLEHRGAAGIVVETEAYDPTDPASHSFRGRTARNAAMFGPAGHLYVYRSHGIHWCLNVVCGAGGSAVLVRALEPRAGIPAMIERRGTGDVHRLCAGPGRLCQALAIDGRLDGAPLADEVSIVLPASPVAVRASRRIGITRAAEVEWRFTATGSKFLSRPDGRRAESS